MSSFLVLSQLIYSVISNKNLRHWSDLQCPPPGIVLIIPIILPSARWAVLWRRRHPLHLWHGEFSAAFISSRLHHFWFLFCSVLCNLRLFLTPNQHFLCIKSTKFLHSCAYFQFYAIVSDFPSCPQSDTNWWKGTCRGRTGLIPSNYGE